MPKSSCAADVIKFTDIPNVGKAMERDFRALGMNSPRDLVGRDPYRLYQAMCERSGSRQDPCVLDTYLAVCDFMNGGPSRPWWDYTATRKKQWPDL